MIHKWETQVPPGNQVSRLYFWVVSYVQEYANNLNKSTAVLTNDYETLLYIFCSCSPSVTCIIFRRDVQCRNTNGNENKYICAPSLFVKVKKMNKHADRRIRAYTWVNLAWFLNRAARLSVYVPSDLSPKWINSSTLADRIH